MDPLLSNTPYSYSDYDDKLEDLYRRKRALETTSSRASSTIFSDVEKEFEGLNDEQKNKIYSDPDYQKHMILFSEVVQAELLNFIRPRLLQNETVIKILEDQRDTIRLIKKQITTENEKRLADFKDYTENYSHMTYDEYLKNK